MGTMTPSALPVIRNTALLSAALASHSAMLSLTAAVASITRSECSILEWLLGLGPAAAHRGGARGGPGGTGNGPPGSRPGAGGRLRCRRRRLRARRAGQRAGLHAGGARRPRRRRDRQRRHPARPDRGRGHVPARAPGARHRPGAVRRGVRRDPRPAVFSPLLAGRDLGADTLAALWLAGAGFELAGLALVAAVRPDLGADRGPPGSRAGGGDRARGADRRDAAPPASPGRWWRPRRFRP